MCENLYVLGKAVCILSRYLDNWQIFFLFSLFPIKGTDLFTSLLYFFFFKYACYKAISAKLIDSLFNYRYFRSDGYLTVEDDHIDENLWAVFLKIFKVCTRCLSD